MIRSERESFLHRERDRPSRARPIGAIIDRLGVDPATMPRDALSSTSVTSSHSRCPAPAAVVARKTVRSEKRSLAGRGARARARVATVAVSEGESRRGKEIVLLLFLLVRRYVPAQDPIEQTLTPRDDVGAKKREREKERARETERGRRSIRGGTSGTRGRNGIEVEREETINNTRGKTEKRMTGGSAGGSRKYRAVRDLLGPSLSSRHLPRGGFREHARLLKTASRA